MRSSAGKIELAGFDDLFQTGGETVQEVPLSDPFPFKDHPRDDEAMQKTVDSIARIGVLSPGIVRPRPEDGYEIIAGHRRKRGNELAVKATMPVLVRNLDDDEATIILIAGLHRLEAAKLLGWTEIECTVSGLEGLQAELAEIDENFVRADLSPMDYGNLLLRRKEIYEALHPETKNGGERKSEKIRSAKCTSDFAKSFVDDTAEKLGVDPNTVRRQLQTAKDLTPEANGIIRDAKITKADALKLSRLAPE